MSLANVTKREKKDSTVLHYVMDIFVVLIMCLFPLFFTDRYYNILQAKYYFYISSVIFLLVAMIVVACVEHKRLSAYFSAFKWKCFIRSFSATDYALLTFLLIAGISTVNSDYVYESFWGNEGRYSGLFLLCLYGMAYFGITRFGKLRNWYFDAFLIANLLVCLFGITDYFKMDILYFKEGMLEEQKAMFTSTIGNINTYTALVGMVTAVSAVLFASEEKWKKRCFYFLSLVISFFALITGISDNAYLSLGALFGLLPLYLFRNKRGAKLYLVIIATFFSVIQCIDWINTAMGDKVIGIESMFDIIVQYDGLFPLVVLLWLLCLSVYCIDYFSKRKNKTPNSAAGGLAEKREQWSGGKPLRIIWLVILAICILGLAYALFEANVLHKIGQNGIAGGYLLFNDNWGTHRGYIWRNAIECFEKFPLIKKIFGFGPDTFGILLLEKTENNIYGEFFDNAHNEYLHYLITVGIAGMIAYLAFILSFMVRVIRKAGNNKYIITALFAVACYCTQAFVNLNLPIATPIMWQFLMLGEMGMRNQCRQARNKEMEK